MATPYAVACGDIPHGHLHLLRLADVVLAALPEGATCHDAAAAWLRLFASTGPYARTAARVARGHYLGCYEHSWIELAAPGAAPAVLDVYPVGGTRPLLVSAHVWRSGVASLHPAYRELYREGRRPRVVSLAPRPRDAPLRRRAATTPAGSPGTAPRGTRPPGAVPP